MEEEQQRKQAIGRLHVKRGFRIHLTIALVVIAGLVVIWALTSPGEYFWPVWPALGWGIGIAFHAWATFGMRSISESDIQREMQREQGPPS